MGSNLRLVALVVMLGSTFTISFPLALVSGQEWSDPPPSRANRPTGGPVRLARVSHEEPAEPAPLGTNQDAATPLALPGKQKAAGVSRPSSPSSSRAITTVLGSLGVVLGLFFLVVWMTRRVRPKGSMSLPKEVLEVLGRAPLGSRQQMQLVRVGNKLILLSITPTGAETLTEITDREEVERLASLCQISQPGSVTATFRQVLSQFEKEPARPGFVAESPDDESEAAAASRRRRLARAAR